MTQQVIRHIHHRDDFVLRERFRNGSGSLVPLPDGVDFELRYWVKHGREFVAARRAGVYQNCTPDGDALLVIFKDHNLCEGTLKHELHLQLVNDLMPDGVQNVYYPEDMAVQLWHLATDTAGVIESDMLAAYTRGLPFTYDDFTPEQLAELKGDKGDPFTWADFTTAQIELLQRPATEAAKRADNAAKTATDATAELRKQAQTLVDNSNKAIQDCNTATGAAKSATAKADNAATNAQAAAVATQAERELTEQSRGRLEAVADRAELAAAPIPDGLHVDTPAPVTLGNPVPRYISARVLPAGALQNIIYQAYGGAAGVEPDGRILPFRPGSATVHVIPTGGTQYYKTITVQVVAPVLRLDASGALRLDSTGNIRLT
jgi:hypothetical protein